MLCSRLWILVVRAFFGGTIRRSSLLSVGVDVVMRRSWDLDSNRLMLSKTQTVWLAAEFSKPPIQLLEVAFRWLWVKSRWSPVFNRSVWLVVSIKSEKMMEDIVPGVTPKSKLAKNNNMSDDVRTSGVGSIPLDLIPEILKDLPVKTLARFLCVSKPWGMHHSQPRFREMAVKTLARF
ncbi:hypothetical protein YC2023_054114 [Brassica napus]